MTAQAVLRTALAEPESAQAEPLDLVQVAQPTAVVALSLERVGA